MVGSIKNFGVILLTKWHISKKQSLRQKVAGILKQTVVKLPKSTQENASFINKLGTVEEKIFCGLCMISLATRQT